MNQIRTILYLGALSALLIGLGSLAGREAAIAAALFAVVLGASAYFASDRLVLAMHGARELGPNEAPSLQATVKKLAETAEVPAPRIFVIRSPQPNAFATGRGPAHAAVAVTEGLLATLAPNELEAVLAHEIAHIARGDVLLASVAATLAAAVTYLASLPQWFSWDGGSEDRRRSPLAIVALAIVAPIAALLIRLGISRTREFAADAAGARLCGDPESLAEALEILENRARVIPAYVEPATASLWIVNPLTNWGGFRTLFSSHPPTAERARRLRAAIPSETRTNWDRL